MERSRETGRECEGPNCSSGAGEQWTDARSLQEVKFIGPGEREEVVIAQSRLIPRF